jgi:hypothetical protein
MHRISFHGIICAGLLDAIAASGIAHAESLAGKVGEKRYFAQFPTGVKGPCQKAYKDYVAASGHSAYAQTPFSWGVEAFFCGRAYNAPSQEAAEKHALENCNSVFKLYKVKTVGSCQIYASK